MAKTPKFLQNKQPLPKSIQEAKNALLGISETSIEPIMTSSVPNNDIHKIVEPLKHSSNKKTEAVLTDKSKRKYIKHQKVAERNVNVDMIDDDLKIYSVDEVAAILRLTRTTIYSYIKAKKIKTVKIGKQHRITKSDLKNFTIGLIG